MANEIEDLTNIEEIPYIPINCEKITYNTEYSTNDFKRGIKDSSYYIGIITGIRNCGIDSEDVFDIFSAILNDIKLSDIKRIK